MDIRPLKPEDYEAALILIKQHTPWMTSPPPESLIGKFIDNKLVGVIGIQRPVVVECLVVESVKDIMDLITWVDGMLSSMKYYFFVPDINPKFQETLSKHYSENLESFPGRLYARKRT